MESGDDHLFLDEGWGITETLTDNISKIMATEFQAYLKRIEIPHLNFNLIKLHINYLSLEVPTYPHSDSLSSTRWNVPVGPPFSLWRTPEVVCLCPSDWKQEGSPDSWKLTSLLDKGELMLPDIKHSTYTVVALSRVTLLPRIYCFSRVFVTEVLHCLHPTGCSAAYKHVDWEEGHMLTTDCRQVEVNININISGAVSRMFLCFWLS